MAINLSAKYSSQINQMFTKGSFVDGHFSNNLDFTGAKTVKVYTIGTVTPSAYTRSGANRYGTANEINDGIQEMTMTQDMAFTGTIDKGNSLDQVINKAGQFLKAEFEQEIVPMKDRYTLGVIANGTHSYIDFTGTTQSNVANPGTDYTGAAITSSNVMARVSDARAAFANGLVPEAGRTWFVTTAVFNALIGTPYFINLPALGDKAISKGQVGSLFGAPVIEVPSSIMPSGVNFIFTHKDAICTPSKIADTKVHIDPPGISGHLVEGRYYYDCFTFEQKKAGIYVDRT